ncbi:hypothetical protein G6F22_006657 [Rhizopus arrhizus]|nr:hypothetical protein G6F23_002959 [Rhizopus arrhizus]KAG0789608.1 hypothetical protein G6F22_006657 [Rhizopus arrhizus]KAG0843142.1 hypothetical protein G6F19_000674 [Rhizopus arrhizus]KAG0903942.1 hypothetical protein G6F34_000624 [Rhizopus arrhizus]KAG0971153.1 hypothetical protein G6F31_000201 [Rhizopus arrhizus]
MIHGYDNKWDISRTNEKKSSLILLATGVMKQQPTVRAVLGRVVEEKFHMQAIAMTVKPGISLVSERLREMIHPEVAPIQLGEGVKEGYFYEARGNVVEIPDSTENNQPYSYSPCYTDEDEPYIPPENLFDIRRMSDSSSDGGFGDHDQHGGALTEEMMRCAREELNQMDDQVRRMGRDDNMSNPLIDLSHSEGMYLKILHALKIVPPHEKWHILQETIIKPKFLQPTTMEITKPLPESCLWFDMLAPNIIAI